ncbi:hypothetical protein, partial [Legionella gresilensis]|uniref:hypothetical protein n=1 Tax=Legionella gresilensis TaxID=91823 RepID=UPI001A94E8C7
DRANSLFTMKSMADKALSFYLTFSHTLIGEKPPKKLSFGQIVCLITIALPPTSSFTALPSFTSE